MTSRIIAKIRLAKGEVAFYDELSRIHLTLSRPTADVYDYMNAAVLRRAIMNKRIILVAGTLLPITKTVSECTEQTVSPAALKAKAFLAKEEAVEVIAESTCVVEEAKEETVTPVIEEAVEEVVEVKPKKKSTRKKVTEEKTEE